MSFSVDMAKFAKKTNSTLDEVSRAIPIAVFNGVIRDTRVDTGRLRGNWQTTVGEPASGSVGRINKIPQFEDGGSAQIDVLRKVKSFSIVYLTNNLPYAKVWEEKDGMISKNIARINRYVKEAVRDVV